MLKTLPIYLGKAARFLNIAYFYGISSDYAQTKSCPRSVMERGLNLSLSYKCRDNQYNTNYHIQSTQNSKSIFNLFAFK